MSDFAKNLRYFRKQKKYSQADLGKKLHYGYTAIANYESGRNEPAFDDLISLAKLLDVTTDELLGVNTMQEGNKLLSGYRKLIPKHQKIVSDLIEILLTIR